MGPGVAFPLAAFATVVIIVALVYFAQIHDLESAAQHRVHHLEIEHREAIQRLEKDLSDLRKKIRS